MKKLFTILGILALLSAIFVMAAKPNPGHNAPEISGGTFSANDGAFQFPTDVGIGITPTERFQVKSPGTSSAVVQHISSDSQVLMQLFEDSSTNGRLSVYGTGNNVRVMLNSAGNSYFTGGNVGIGTASPSSYSVNADNLVIYENGFSGMTIASGTSSAGGIYFADGTTGNEAYRGWIQYDHNSDKIDIGTAGGAAIYIDSSGDVGIGDSNPAAKLDIADSTVGSGHWALRVVQNGYSSGLWYDDGNDPDFILRDASGNADVEIRTDGDSWIKGTGQLGIGGVTDPTRPLEVEDGIKVSDDSAGGRGIYTYYTESGGVTCTSACLNNFGRNGACLAGFNSGGNSIGCGATATPVYCLCADYEA